MIHECAEGHATLYIPRVKMISTHTFESSNLKFVMETIFPSIAVFTVEIMYNELRSFMKYTVLFSPIYELEFGWMHICDIFFFVLLAFLIVSRLVLGSTQPSIN